MEEIQIKAHAKINLTLDILGKRSDGYHKVEMIMQAIDLHDIISIKKSGQSITVGSDSNKIPLNKENLVYKAAKLFAERTNCAKGLDINIKKRIPVAAGLAGGSTDAAATLVGLNKLMGTGISIDDLMLMGAEIGSDVPFCIIGGTALAYGRGELIRPLAPLPKLWVLLAKPDIEVSTATVYKNFNPGVVSKRPGTTAMIAAIEGKDYRMITEQMANVLETVTLKMHPEVERIKKLMVSYGIRDVMMSGSGPTVFGLSQEEDQIIKAARELAKQIPTVIVTNTI